MIEREESMRWEVKGGGQDRAQNIRFMEHYIFISSAHKMYPSISISYEIFEIHVVKTNLCAQILE